MTYTRQADGGEQTRVVAVGKGPVVAASVADATGRRVGVAEPGVPVAGVPLPDGVNVWIGKAVLDAVWLGRGVEVATAPPEAVHGIKVDVL